MKNTLIGELVKICGDYKNINFDSNHVNTWINQFNVDDHIFILENLVRILKKTYFSEDYVNRIISQMGIDILTIYSNPNIKIGILNINKSGGSQLELGLKLKAYFDSVNRKSDLVSVQEYYLNRHDIYIYLDDFLYSGNKLKYALKDIYPIYNNRKDIFIYFIGIYNQGYNYIYNDLEVREILSVGVKRFLLFNNLLTERELPFTVLYPQRNSLDEKLKRGRLYSVNNDFLFENNQDRTRLENIFYEYGKNIISQVKIPAPSLRELGFSLISQWGFGSMVVLYRNIANNSPLALWYGNVQSYTNGNQNNNILGNFYPLFPRKVN